MLPVRTLIDLDVVRLPDTPFIGIVLKDGDGRHEAFSLSSAALMTFASRLAEGVHMRVVPQQSDTSGHRHRFGLEEFDEETWHDDQWRPLGPRTIPDYGA
jgi:hypothetical protein